MKTFLNEYSIPNPFATLESAVDAVKGAIESLKTKIQGFKTWIGGISIPNPLAGLSNAASGAVGAITSLLPGHAMGTLYSPGGLALVGEGGPEIVALPRGSRVINSTRTREFIQTQASPVTVVVNANVNSNIDVDELAYRISSIIQRRARR